MAAAYITTCFQVQYFISSVKHIFSTVIEHDEGMKY